MMEWFERENKPVTAQSLTDALGSRVSKPMVQKNLDELLALGKLQCKDLKKVRFYFLSITPTEAEAALNMPEQQEQLIDEAVLAGERETVEAADTEEKERLIDQLCATIGTIRRKEAMLGELMRRPTAADRAAQAHQVTADIERITEEIDGIVNANRSTPSSTSRDERGDQSVENLALMYHKVRGLWRERKEFTYRLIDTVIGDQFSLEELSEMIGIVTEEESGISFQETCVALPSSLAKPRSF
ncbi:26S proteasome regulatory subunit, ATPase 3, interacting protein [Strigomonas culicis]|nr:26S proteasome regulatory subunit, ATPase 3, interacting protein [Strigomonas culicis]|eukprot:EPY30885.1 26S proteasome regulatory subunit, ATPase 3, interacting protein [Strigomonas culicis]